MRLFISHSSKDKDFVELLVELLQSALSLRPTDIRCSSLDGYRLPGGAHVETQLRTEVFDAEALVGVISSASVESLYVAFELGARWGHQKHLLPVMAPGGPAELLGGPLQSLNALRADSRAQLHQLVDDLSNVLKVDTQSPAAYGKHIDAILASAGSKSDDAAMVTDHIQTEDSEREWPSLQTLDTLQRRLKRQSKANKRILAAVARSGGYIYVMQLAEDLSIDRAELVYRGKELESQQLIVTEQMTDTAYELHDSISQLLGENAHQLLVAMIGE